MLSTISRKVLVKAGFILMLILLAFYFYGHKMLDDRPQSVHAWRQADCLSVSLNYYENGMRFLHPEIHYRISDDGTTGYSAGEFPGLYYFVAALWKIVGPHEWVYRLLVWLLFATGIYALFILVWNLSNNWFTAACVALTLYTSPVLFFYSVNFLTNVPALSLVLISWYILYLYHQRDHWIWLVLWGLLVALAGLLKVPALISILAMGGAMGVGWLFKLPHPFRGREWKLLSILAGSFALVFLWYWYAAKYNDIHGGKYTFNGIWPLWETATERIQSTWISVKELWFREYHYKWFIYVSGVALLMNLLSPRKLYWIAWLMLLFMVLGMMLYAVLWFQALHDHDYYLINMFVIFPVLWYLLLDRLLRIRTLLKVMARFVLLGLLLFSAVHVRNRMYDRYQGWWNTGHRDCFSSLYHLEQVNRGLGILEEDLVIVPGDISFNVSLYLMDQPGWTAFGIDYSRPENTAELIRKGAEYLFLIQCKDQRLNGIIPYIADTLYYEEPLIICSLQKHVKRENQ